MLSREAKALIDMADMYIRQGVNTKHLTNEEVKKMMKKIAANAVVIGLYNFDGCIISNISEGDFATIKKHWKDAIDGMVKCLAIINNEGDDLIDILGLEEIEEAVRFTIFELGTSEDDDE